MSEKVMNSVKFERYNNLDGLRGYLALLMIIIHVFTNGNYTAIASTGGKIISYLANFVLMFLVISGFAVCCGYYEKFKYKKISPEEFYSKRYIRTLPYFAFLVLLDLAVNPSLNSLYEAFADLTLCFGFLPNGQISVIGVGWTLGVIFAFYLLFPFFVFLLSDKKKGWISLSIAVIFYLLCSAYFFDSNHVYKNFVAEGNIVYSAVFFLIGGMVYLYREQLKKAVQKCSFVWLLLLALTVFLYVLTTANKLVNLVLFALLLIYVIGIKDAKFLYNPVTRFLSKHSMEIYLSHMVIFRIAEKLNMIHIFSSDILSYCAATLIVIAGTVAFAWITKMCVDKITVLLLNKFKNNPKLWR